MSKPKKKRVVFFAFTPYHLLSSLYYAKTIDWVGYEKVLVFQQILSKKFNCSIVSEYFDRIIDFDCRRYSNRIKKIIDNQIASGWLYGFSETHKLLSDSNAIIFVFSDQNYMINRALRQSYSKRCNYIFMVDEGIAAYSITKKEHGFKSLKNSIMGKKTVPYVGASGLFDAWVLNNPSLLPNEKKLNKAIVLKNNVFIDNDFVNSFEISIDCIKNNNNQKKVLWLSGPLTDINVSEEEEVSFLERIVKALPDFYFMIKFHPRENINKYDSLLSYSNVEILEMNEYFFVPIELFAKQLSPDVVLTVCSSALRELQSNGVEAKYYYCYKILEKAEFDYSVFDDLVNTTNNYFPSDMHELIRSISQDCYVQQDLKSVNSNKDIKFIERIRDQINSKLAQ